MQKDKLNVLRVLCHATQQVFLKERHVSIILRIAVGGASRPLSISTDTAVLDASLPYRPLRIFGKLATSLLI